MKTHYVHVIQQVWRVLFWAGLIVGQTAWAQSVPDSQWARVGKTLAITTDGNIVTADGGIVVKYAMNGDEVARSGRLQGNTYLGGKLQGCPNCLVNGYAPVESILRIAPTVDGGVAVLGRECCEPGTVFAKLNVQLRQESATVGGSFVIGTSDGGYVNLAAGAEYTTVNYQPVYTGRKVATVTKSGLQTGWSRTIVFPTQNLTGPDNSLTKANVAINTPDGGYLVGGYYNSNGDDSPQIGWVAKLDGQGTISWQKLLSGLPLSHSFNGPPSGSIIETRNVTDLILAADGNGYALVGTAIGPSSRGVGPTTGAILELNADGSFKRGRSTGEPPTESFITTYTDSGGKKYYAVGNSSLQNGTDPQILLIDPASLPLSDPDLFKVAARRTFEGPGDGPLTDIATAGDGSLVFVTANNQVVKLTTGTFRLTQPSYDCASGAITFNTAGGNGSLITYNAPGISRSSATSNTGTVEQGLRNDPKSILITATQSGVSATYSFDLRAACNSTPVPKPPTYNTIPDQSYVVGLYVFFQIGSYFNDPTTGVPNYDPGWSFQAEGLPDGLEISNRSYATPNVPILGTPTKAGVYTVNLVVSTSAFRDKPIRTSFRITVSPSGQPPVDPPTPPTGGTLALNQPTYNCQTGAITFNTTGGNGSAITYNAPGISRSSASSNTGTVEQGLRNDPKPLTITATQNGQTVSYTFDFGAFCAGTLPPVPPTPPVNPPTPPTPPTGSTLTLLAPSYDCGSGAITFRTSGGNGSPIEYAAAGITGWTTNPNQFVDQDSRTANDVKPFTLMARQNGVSVTYIWDLKAACGRARVGSPERVAELRVRVLGNPVSDAVRVEVAGAEGRPLHFGLLDVRGRLVESRLVEQAGSAERQVFDVGQQGPGLLLLRVSSGTRTKTVKIMKQ